MCRAVPAVAQFGQATCANILKRAPVKWRALPRLFAWSWASRYPSEVEREPNLVFIAVDRLLLG
eukprot:959115-Prorocentrum_lima.AAC.1